MIHRIARRVPAPVRDRVKRHLQPPILREGERAPEWHLVGHDGTVYSQGDHWTLFVLYPRDDTAGCTAQLLDVEAHREALEGLGVRCFGVNPANQTSHAAFAEKLGLGFPLLIDVGLEHARQLGCTWTVPLQGESVIRTVYLVNPEGRIRIANRGAPPIAAIVRSLQALQGATKTGM